MFIRVHAADMVEEATGKNPKMELNADFADKLAKIFVSYSSKYPADAREGPSMPPTTGSCVPQDAVVMGKIPS